jgi:L-tartrate/succinate antiporter
MGAAPSSPIAGGRASSCATSRPERFALPPPALAPAHRRALGRALPPLGVGLALALTPTPEGLTVEAWHYFALFAAVIIAIVTEPLPAAVVSLAGVVAAAMLGLVHPTPALSINWALGGFSNPLSWLVLSTLVLASGYEKTALGRRIALGLIRRLGRSTLGLGYAIALTDLTLAPFTPSNTARSAGTIYPVIRSIPGLFGSSPEREPRRLGAYIMYTALAATCVTSSMFPTAIAANLLAVAIVAETMHIDITWREWVIGFAPVGAVLFLLVPLVLYWIYPPGLKRSPGAPAWAARELRAMGPMSLVERTMLAGILLVVGLWIFGSRFSDPTAAAILGVIVLVARGIVTWEDVVGNRQAWNLFVWFSTLITLAGGLADVGFVRWLADHLQAPMTRAAFPYAVATLVAAFFFLHYFFATVSGHAAALLPVFLIVATGPLGLPPREAALSLAYTLGLMGILTPYATGPAPVYYTCGFIRKRDFWWFGLVMGSIFLACYLLIGLPWLMLRS